MNKRYRWGPRLLLTGLLTTGMAGCGARPPEAQVAASPTADAAPPAAVEKSPPGPAGVDGKEVAAPQEGRPEPSAPPRDAAARAVAEFLRPSEKLAGLAADRSGPLPRKVPKALERPELPAPAADVRLPAAPLRLPPSRIGPRPPAAGLPLAHERTDDRFPPTVLLPDGPLITEPGPDLHRPAPVPLLSESQPDRLPLTDPTRDASLEAALAASVTLRTTPAPSDNLRVPDPYEYRDARSLRALPPEPVALPPSPPRTLPKTLAEKGPVRAGLP